MTTSVYEQDTILLEQLKKGETEAFNWFYHKHRRFLTVLAFSILENETDAMELVQEFFVDFWQKQLYNKIDPSGKNNGFIKGYINRIVHNRCIDKIQQRKLTNKRLSALPVPDSATSSPEEIWQAKEWQREIRKKLTAAIDEVPPLSAKVFQMAYLQHKSRNEIAAELGVSPHTVKNQLARALRILRERLKNLSF